jgi:hypothetical protein
LKAKAGGLAAKYRTEFMQPARYLGGVSVPQVDAVVRIGSVIPNGGHRLTTLPSFARMGHPEWLA